MIVIKGLTKSYQDKTIFTNVHFEAAAGQVIVLMGKSGIGKTTFLNILAGLTSATITSYTYQGKSIAPQNDETMSAFRNQHIGYIPQDFALIQDYTVKENLLLPALYHPHLTTETIKQTVLDLTQQFEIADILEQKVKDISGGQKQRVAIIRSLVLNPDILLADEPTANLDSENVELVLRLFKEQQAAGKILIIATHDERICELATHLYQIKHEQLHLTPPLLLENHD